MKATFFTALIIGLIIGAGATYAIMKSKTEASTATNADSMASHNTMNHDMSDMSMNAMMSELKGRSGDDFDKAFIEMMIEHHQGAIDMANAAKASAKHDEIKTMADDIISAQSKEIEQMKNWQTQWGY